MARLSGASFSSCIAYDKYVVCLPVMVKFYLFLRSLDLSFLPDTAWDQGLGHFD